jgi:MoaA/NifB/PqqE/SkfB family radical SAM enzyme
LVETILSWLSLAKKALIVSVPFEQKLSHISQHKTFFNPERLGALAKTVSQKAEHKFIAHLQHLNSGIVVFSASSTILEGVEDVISYYNSLDSNKKSKLRFDLAELLVANYFDSPQEVESIFRRIFQDESLDFQTAIFALREILIQPMASSLWVLENLNKKYGIRITVSDLIRIFTAFQGNHVVQDIIRFNSSGSKVLAVARGVMLKKKSTTYYFDVQTTDTCPSLCTKCWRYYQDDGGVAHLMPREHPTNFVRPSFTDFQRVFHQAIDLGVESNASTGGGEPFMNLQLPELLADAKAYAVSKGINLRVFVPVSGLGRVYNDPKKLELIINTVDLLRFSFDSFDKDFVMKNHGVSEAGFNMMLRNFRKVVELKHHLQSNIDIEVLILLYRGNYQHAETTIEKAYELGATRVLINSITGNDAVAMDQEEAKLSARVLRRIYERLANGDFGVMQIDFDPVLMGGYANISQVDRNNLERPLGNIRYCMKNVFGLTPVVTADGTFHVCFPCSQPNIANRQDIFKIGNIMEDSIEALVARMRDNYRDIDPEEDCIKDCRDIPYFNGIFRKVIEDILLGIPVTAQPFLDRSDPKLIVSHTLHSEVFNQGNLSEVMDEMNDASRQVFNDKVSDFKESVLLIEQGRVAFDPNNLAEGVVALLFDRYQTRNIFDIHAVRWEEKTYLFSYDISMLYELGSNEFIDFIDVDRLPAIAQDFLRFTYNNQWGISILMIIRHCFQRISLGYGVQIHSLLMLHFI